MAGEFGLGAASRMVARMVRASGLPLSTTTIYPLEQRNDHEQHLIGEGARYCFSILAINANGLQSFSCDPHYELHRNRPKVGVWYWEVDKLPVSMRPAYELVDEVWCSTEYMRSSLARWTEGTVRKHPLIIDVPERAAVDHEDRSRASRGQVPLRMHLRLCERAAAQEPDRRDQGVPGRLRTRRRRRRSCSRRSTDCNGPRRWRSSGTQPTIDRTSSSSTSTSRRSRCGR